MIENYYISFIFGLLLKVYDDVIDNSVYKAYFSQHIITLIKIIMIVILIKISLVNGNIPFIILMTMIIHYILADNKCLDDIFWHLGLIVLGILVLYTFSLSNLKYNLYTIILLVSILWADHKLFPEEYSWKKIIGRTIMVIGLLCLLEINQIFDHDILWFCYGYMMTSVANMLYLVKIDT